jgi:hypothetical protein
MALEKTDQQREIYWGGIDNTTIPTMEKLAEEKKVTAELSRQEVITQRLLNIDDEIAKAKKDAANGTAEDIKKYKELKKEKRALMKEEAEHAKIMAKEDGKKYTLTSLQADLEEKIGDMLKEEVGWTTKLSSNLYTQGVAQKSFLMDRLQIVNTGQSIYDWGVRLTDVLNNGTENQKKWAQAMTPMVSMGGKMIDDAISLGGAYDNIGSGTFMDMTKSMDEQLKKAERYKDYVKKEIIPALKADQEQLEETLKTQKKGSEEWKKTKEQIEENKQEQKESNALAQENVDKAKNLTAEAKRQKVLHGQTASTVAFIAEPFEKMKTFFEKTKVGKFVSELVGIGDATEHFTNTFTNYVKDSLDPDNPMNFGLAMSKMWTKTDKNGRVTRGQFKIMFDKFEEGFSKLKEVFTGINKSMGGMLGPALAIVAILMIAKKVAEMFYGGMAETRKEFGLTFTEAAGLQQILNTTAMEMKFLGVSAEDVKAGAVGIMDNLGGIGQITQSNVKEMARLNAMYGISGESSGVLAAQMMAVGASSIDAVGAQLDSVAALSQANGVAPAKIMEDVAGSSESFAGFAKDGGQNVFKAAIAARKLGLSMSTVESMADSLLDFETSINAQMEASMLLGRNINTDKARELALAGDLEGMQKEITKQIGSASDWNALNIVQRKSLAAAFGMEVSEMGKMITNQDKLNNMTTAQKKRQDLIADVMKKIGEIWTRFLGIFKALLPLAIGLLSPFLLIAGVLVYVLGLFADIIEWLNEANVMGVGLGDVIMFAAGAALLFRTNLMSGGIMGALGKMKDMIFSMGSKMTGVAKKMVGMGGDDVPLTKSGKPDKRFGKRADKTKSVKKPAPGKKGGGKGKGPLGGMFEKFDAKKALAGAAALLIIAAALWVTAKALIEFGKVSWGAMAKAGVALLGLVLVLAAIGAIMMSGVGAVAILAGAGAMLIMAAALLVLGVAIQAIGKGFDMLAQGLGSFLPTIMTLAPMAKAIFVLAGAFTALGWSMAAMALGALALLPALPVLMTLAALGMLGGSVLGGGGGEETASAEGNPVEIKLDETNQKLERLIGLMGEQGPIALATSQTKTNTGKIASQII